MKQWYLQITAHDRRLERYGVRIKLPYEDRNNEEFIKAAVASWKEAFISQVGEPESFSYMVTNYKTIEDSRFQMIEE